MESLRQKWEDLNLTRDEVKSIGQALQKEEFRNLLVDYVKEINDPENRKLYEQDITQLEKERGVDVKFVHPSPGYVIKTSVNGKNKTFINICSNNNVGKPSSTPGVHGENHGLHWSIPHCLAPPREDLDKKNNSCIVYDVVFHPDTLHLSQNNVAFKQLVNDTALGAVEDNFNVTLDKINLKFPKMQFKGLKHPTVIRTKIKHFKPSQSEDLTEIPNYPYPPVSETAQSPLKSEKLNVDTSKYFAECSKGNNYTKPNYNIKYRNNIDMQDYTNDPMSKMTLTTPNELVIAIHLPLLKSASDASLDVTENKLFLISEKPVKYKLDLKLPYVVDSNKGNAKFDIVKRLLTVTLSVLRQNVLYHSIADLGREDSGVESDNCNGRSGSVSSGDEDALLEDHHRNKTELSGLSGLDNNTEIFSNSNNKQFLKSDSKYNLPVHSSQIVNNNLTFTIQVPHVNPDTVEYCFLKNGSGFHLCFTSLGSGFFPVNYAICVLLPYPNQMENKTFNVEVWDNNVITQVNLVSGGISLLEYFVGVDETNLEKVTLMHKEEALENSSEKVKIKEAFENENFGEENISGNKSKDELSDSVDFPEGGTHCSDEESISGSLQPFESQDEVSDSPLSKINIYEKKPIDKLLEEEKDPSVSESASSFDESNSSPPRQPAKSRTMSESTQGEFMRTTNRGILKIGRSLSESSVDDYASWSNDKIEKTKKTVRFSEVISKQTFRMNSSILGQRKKNQRKTKNKKRAQERRLSESGGESEGESEAASTKINNPNRKEIDVWVQEAESSSCDASEISEVSDISESDDGQKEEGKTFVPCSSRRNHKRRGKKSARKNAATAKFQFIEN